MGGGGKGGGRGGEGRGGEGRGGEGGEGGGGGVQIETSFPNRILGMTFIAYTNQPSLAP